MAFSYKEYTSRDAGQREFTFAFDAVAKDTTNIKVTIGGKHLYDGVSKYNTSTRALDDTSGSVQDAEYTVSTGSITIKSDVSFTVGNATIASGVPNLSATVPLRIYRETNRNTAEVTFSSGSILADSDLNKANNQGRFLALEAVDRADESMSIDPDDSTQYDIQISGADKRIFGVDNPNNTNDAANKAYVDGVAMGSGANIVTTDGSQTLTAKTLTSPVLNTGVSGTAIKDEDDMSSDSASHLATQQSIKAYVDAQIATEDTIAELNDTTITGTPADNEVLAYDSSSSKWINQTASEAGLAASSDLLSLIDEDDMATDSNTRPPSQQSVKAYADQLAFQGEPHIIPGVLYPAVAGKLLDGSTSHSGNYGTTQSDGRSYYYTDIKGSKPIKDPRIGGHFGSQRHKFKSTQLLEQETATHGQDVYSIDGREWARATAPSGKLTHYNRFDGQWFRVYQTTDAFYEVTGYFSAVNILDQQWTSNRDLSISIDGSVTNANFQEVTASVLNPLADHSGSSGRYVDAASVFSVATGLTLGIHTIKIAPQSSSDYADIFGIELIAQDTSNRNNIQIPSQDVVSYGKKFIVSAEGSSGHHYDPFNGFVNGTSLHSAFVDTATSLGLDSAPGSSAKWAISSTNHIRPYQGGRVVKWVDSDGTIKTSVNMMPPNAQNFSSSADSEVTTPSATNTNYKPAFSDDTIDFQNSEIAKTFFAREMGNGGANGNASYRDATVANSDHNIAYVLDDGLTSLSAEAVSSYNNFAVGSIGAHNSDFDMYFTFIGSGIGYYGKSFQNNIASNLPYGTHILKIGYDGTNSTIDIDGIQVFTGSANERYYSQYSFNIHQPKRPPIPEDACVLADYMLMADFVAQTAGTVGHISKGTRLVSSSRDHFYDASGVTFTTSLTIEVSNGWSVSCGALGSGNTATIKLPYFGTDFLMGHFANRVGTITENLNSDVGTYSNISTTTYSGLSKHTGNNLGLNELKNHITDGLNDDQLWHSHSQIASPIHTSSHYQSFETPFLHELVGGDRNMEQTNLVCSPDGKTWDQLTRDVSYIGKVSLVSTTDTATAWADYAILDEWRGNSSNTDFFNKDFAIAYDRIICLEEGFYQISLSTRTASGGDTLVYINGSDFWAGESNSPTAAGLSFTKNAFLKRGDYVQIRGEYGGASLKYNSFQISKL